MFAINNFFYIHIVTHLYNPFYPIVQASSSVLIVHLPYCNCNDHKTLESIDWLIHACCLNCVVDFFIFFFIFSFVRLVPFLSLRTIMMEFNFVLSNLNHAWPKSRKQKERKKDVGARTSWIYRSLARSLARVQFSNLIHSVDLCNFFLNKMVIAGFNFGHIWCLLLYVHTHSNHWPIAIIARSFLLLLLESMSCCSRSNNSNNSESATTTADQWQSTHTHRWEKERKNRKQQNWFSIHWH